MPEYRVRFMITSMHRKVRADYAQRPLWTFIREITGHGCGYSCEICIKNGWNPEQDASIEIA